MAFNTLVDILRWRGRNQSNQRAYSFLIDGDVERSVHITYGQLDLRAHRIAEYIKTSVEPLHQPVLLLFSPGLEVVATLFGCFYAGAIAIVPDFPRRRSALSIIESIIVDAGVTVGLIACRTEIEIHLDRSASLRKLRWLSLDEIIHAPLSTAAAEPAPPPDSIAVLQYTSGSTGTPKGVMVSHGNIIKNSTIIKRRFQQTESSRTVFWVPPSHDMGLIGGVFQPLYVGYPGTFMPPLSFMQKPVRWLHAISVLRATTTAAPNFAYDWCVRKTTPAQRDGLDLSTWDVAINGAEPVQAVTIERFSEFFAPCGFRRDAFCPSYGLAEATLVVSGEKQNRPPTVTHIPAASRGGDGATLVGCGRADQDHRIVIVDPELGLPCNPGEVGEIWVEGGSVAQGYWNRPEETAAAFGAHLSNSGEGPFLRTGDLGCVINAELFPVGRLKDIIIVRGINYSPYAIEQTVERCHPALRPSCGAVFMAKENGEKCLVVIHELERNVLRTMKPQEVFDAIRGAVAEEHDLEVQSIVLLRTASLPKTMTGKTKRQSCLEGYLNGSLNALANWSTEASGDPGARSAPIETAPSVEMRREPALRAWLVQRLSQQLNVPAVEIDIKRPFAEYGLDSAAVVGLAGDLQDYLDWELSPTVVYDYPTIESLCLYLAEKAPSTEAGGSGGR